MKTWPGIFPTYCGLMCVLVHWGNSSDIDEVEILNSYFYLEKGIFNTVSI